MAKFCGGRGEKKKWGILRSKLCLALLSQFSLAKEQIDRVEGRARENDDDDDDNDGADEEDPGQG